MNWGSLAVRTNVYTDTSPAVNQLAASNERRAVRKRLADVAVNLLMEQVLSDSREGAAAALRVISKNMLWMQKHKKKQIKKISMLLFIVHIC